MGIELLSEDVAKRLESLAYLAGRDIIVEEKGDTAYKLSSSIAKTRFAVIVGWNGFECTTPDCASVYGNAKIVVSVFEQPLKNRESTASPRLLKSAQEIAKHLHLYHGQDASSPLVFRRITPVSELGDGKTIACDIEFETTTIL